MELKNILEIQFEDVLHSGFAFEQALILCEERHVLANALVRSEHSVESSRGGRRNLFRLEFDRVSGDGRRVVPE